MGNVKSFKFSKEGKLLNQSVTGNGYYFVGPVIDGRRDYVHIHVAIATCFIPNPQNHKVVNHKNGIKSDNRVENLEWVSYRENQCHARTILGKGSKSSKYYGVHFKKGDKRIKRWGAILCFDKQAKHIGYFLTEDEAHEAYQRALVEHGLENKYLKAS